MSIEEIIRIWKAENPDWSKQRLPENPVGNELSDEGLEEVLGGQVDWYAVGYQTCHRTACSSAVRSACTYTRHCKCPS